MGSAFPVVSAGGSGSALWRVVHDFCVPDTRLTGHAAPCAKVDLHQGYVVVEDRENATQLLLVPTARITGIEDPRLFEAETPNYWALAWDNRDLLESRARRALPRERFGLVVNSVYGRTQNQLHIHIDCLRVDVVQALSEHMDEIGTTWRPLDIDLVGRRYLTRWLSEQELANEDPFKLIRAYRDRTDMARQTLVLAGAVSAARGPGFVLLDDQADDETGDTGHGEDLLDHRCQGGGTQFPTPVTDYGVGMESPAP
jgi:CDP-diacylglycerol pyrophosphatase